MEKLKVLDLFSGIGGFSLGLERTGGFETVAFCEIDPFCRRVLAKHWPDVRCFEDVTTLRGEDVGTVDVICGGFPCQDISSAGRKVGLAGKRSGLWREYARLIGELRPRIVLVENVSALLSRGMGTVLGDLAELGFDAEWGVISAEDMGADHGRDRLWIAAYPNRDGEPVGAVDDEARRVPQDGALVHPERRQSPMGLQLARAWRFRKPLAWNRVWAGENSPMGMGVDDGLPQRLDRLRALGNAVVPQIPELIGHAILQSMRAAA